MLDPRTLGMVADAHRNEMLKQAERDRIARQVGRETVKSDVRQRARLGIRQPLGNVITRLGVRIAGAPTSEPVLRDAVST